MGPIGVLLCISVWGIVIAVYDAFRRRVPNAMLLLALIPALLALAFNGRGLLGVGTGSSIVGLIVAGALTLPGYLLGQMGAGDVKLAAVLGLIAGYSAALSSLLISALILGGMGLTALILRKLLRRDWRKMPAAGALVGGFLGYFWHLRLAGLGA